MATGGRGNPGTIATGGARPGAAALHVQAGPSQMIEFYGEVFTNPADHRAFLVYAGDGAPTVTGGYAKYDTIDRPQRIGLTVFQGYDPIALKIPIRFLIFAQDGSRLTDDNAGLHVEIDIRKLEWMAGRGIGSQGGEELGESPRVFVSTTDANGNSVPLIPFNWQPTSSSVNPALRGPSPDQPWVITEIDWDENPERNPSGYRIRQDATVVLTQFIEDAALNSTSAATRSRNTKKNRGKTKTVVAGPGKNTCLLIAKSVGARNIYQAGEEIKKANPRLHISSASKTVIKAGTRVRVPVVL